MNAPLIYLFFYFNLNMTHYIIVWQCMNPNYEISKQIKKPNLEEEDTGTRILKEYLNIHACSRIKNNKRPFSFSFWS